MREQRDSDSKLRLLGLDQARRRLLSVQQHLITLNNLEQRADAFSQPISVLEKKKLQRELQPLSSCDPRIQQKLDQIQNFDLDQEEIRSELRQNLFDEVYVEKFLQFDEEKYF